MRRKQILKMIAEEVVKLEEKHSMPYDVDWLNPFEDCSVELAYQVARRWEKKMKEARKE